MRSAGRIFVALSVLALGAALFYGIYVHELAGAVMLGVFSVALVYIATVLVGAGDYDRAENEQDAEPEIGPEHTFPPSWWPLVMAVGAVAAVVGLKFQVVVAAIGLGVFLVAAAGWFVQAGRQAAHTAHTTHEGEPTH